MGRDSGDSDMLPSSQLFGEFMEMGRDFIPNKIKLVIISKLDIIDSTL